VRTALEYVEWPGRMEFVPGSPPMVIDGAHNRASMERLIEALGRHFPGRRAAVVFGSAADKDVDGMLAALADGLPDTPVVVTRTDNPRAADPADLAARFRARTGREAAAVPDVAEAVRRAADAAGPHGLVAVCGSLYLVGEVKTEIGNRKAEIG